MTRLARALALLALVAAAPATAQRPTRWRAYSDSAEGARVRGDWPGYAVYIDSVYGGLGNYPTVLWARARAAARLGNASLALERLRTFAATGLYRDVAADSAFLPMAGDPELQRIKQRIDANGAAPVRTSVFVTIDDSLFVPESIAHDPRSGDFYISSIKHGTIDRVTKEGRIEPVARSTDGGLWSGFGLAIDGPRRTLWLASQEIPHYDGFSSADSGRTGVAAFDLASKRWTRRLPGPDDRKPHSFGDAAVMADGTLLVADAEGGGVYASGLRDTVLRVVVQPGVIVSPQGLAPTADGRGFYVADYALGLSLVDQATGRVELLAHPDSIVTNGVDGLIRVGSSLVGVQNGFVPRRVVRYDLDASGRRIVRAKVLESNREFLGETTHLTHVDGKIYFMARTGFDRFGANGKLRPAASLEKPIVGVVRLDGR